MPTLSDALQPLRSAPGEAAILLDVDGTLAPIVRHASDAQVPQPTRAALIAVARRYGLVACVSGRPAAIARRIVSIGSITYVGNHGCELLAGGTTEVELDPQVAAWTGAVHDFYDAQRAEGRLERLRVLFEDKGPIVAFHWRGAPDEEAALAAVRGVETAARGAGLLTHWGRKVLEVRPPVPIDKGRGVAALLAAHPRNWGLYVGDDVTDLDAFRGLREHVPHALCVGVASEETPAALEEAADIMVAGPGGVRELLEELLR
ncbi:MAG: trehalose-phosphatase [Solirubrobacteraceae bacterium]